MRENLSRFIATRGTLVTGAQIRRSLGKNNERRGREYRTANIRKVDRGEGRYAGAIPIISRNGRRSSNRNNIAKLELRARSRDRGTTGRAYGVLSLFLVLSFSLSLMTRREKYLGKRRN